MVLTDLNLKVIIESCFLEKGTNLMCKFNQKGTTINFHLQKRLRIFNAVQQWNKANLFFLGPLIFLVIKCLLCTAPRSGQLPDLIIQTFVHISCGIQLLPQFCSYLPQVLGTENEKLFHDIFGLRKTHIPDILGWWTIQLVMEMLNATMDVMKGHQRTVNPWLDTIQLKINTDFSFTFIKTLNNIDGSWS